MSSIVGFTLIHNLDTQAITAASAAQQRALSHFPHLERQKLALGISQLELWGHKPISNCIQHLPDGSLLALVGSPHNQVSWPDVQASLEKATHPNEFQLPWDGRVILLRISPDGNRWTLWNDWIGSIPVFHAQIGKGRIASTLEPVTVAAAGYTPEDFHLPALLSLLINGHYLADWTLYKDMRVVPPDSCSEWDGQAFRSSPLRTVEPSQERWETGWDDLVDEMHALSHRAIAETLQAQPDWILPLSSGLDSRLIAGVAAEVGANVRTYAWGAPNTTDVVYSRQIARTLDLPWQRVELPKDFLVRYTPWCADLFGSSMHFHGMYQMSFLDEIRTEPGDSALSGFLGDILSGDDVNASVKIHANRMSVQILGDWYTHWLAEDLPALMRMPVQDALSQLREAIENLAVALPGNFHQKLQLLEIQTRQRFFTNFQSTVSDYWRGIANPFMNRAYARFCLSLPRAALDNRRLLSDVYRRYYGRLAVIPGTYDKDPLILTGKYLLKKRLVDKLPSALHRGPFAGFGNVQLRLDTESVQANGRQALWPLFETWDKLSEWLDVDQLERDYQTVMQSKEDIRPLRRLQSAQTLAYRLANTNQ